MGSGLGLVKTEQYLNWRTRMERAALGNLGMLSMLLALATDDAPLNHTASIES